MANLNINPDQDQYEKLIGSIEAESRRRRGYSTLEIEGAQPSSISEMLSLFRKYFYSHGYHALLEKSEDSLKDDLRYDNGINRFRTLSNHLNSAAYYFSMNISDDQLSKYPELKRTKPELLLHISCVEIVLQDMENSVLLRKEKEEKDRGIARNRKIASVFRKEIIVDEQELENVRQIIRFFLSMDSLFQTIQKLFDKPVADELSVKAKLPSARYGGKGPSL